MFLVSHLHVLPQVREKTSAVKEKSAGEKSSAGKKRTTSGKAKSEKESEVVLTYLSTILILHSQHISDFYTPSSIILIFFTPISAYSRFSCSIISVFPIFILHY